MKWTHVSESLPGFGVAVLLTDGKTILVGKREDAPYRTKRGKKPWRWDACGVGGTEWDWEFDDFFTPDPVTHWMPLPDLPNACAHGESSRTVMPLVCHAPDCAIALNGRHKCSCVQNNPIQIQTKEV